LTPRLFGLLLAKARRKANKNSKDASFRTQLAQTLKRTFEIHQFPAFCGFTVALSHILQPVFVRILAADRLNVARPINSPISREAFSSFLASSVAAAGGLQLLNARQQGHAGRTLDLTLFSLVRAIDVIIGELWQRRKVRRVRAGKYTRLEAAIGSLTDPAIFALSSGVVMFAWFFMPTRLPAVYNKQITSIANADERLIEALRRIRSGDFIYGQDTGQGYLLESYCEDMKLPRSWGDPAVTKPIPCEVVHGGETKSCEIYAIRRFLTATLKTALPIYLSLNMLRFLRLRKPKIASIIQAFMGAVRSSAFLGAFVGLFWYSVCLTRTRIGPRLLSEQIYLEKLCVQMGCFLCGWSILVETPRRRTEILFFCSPEGSCHFPSPAVCSKVCLDREHSIRSQRGYRFGHSQAQSEAGEGCIGKTAPESYR